MDWSKSYSELLLNNASSFLDFVENDYGLFFSDFHIHVNRHCNHGRWRDFRASRH